MVELIKAQVVKLSPYVWVRFLCGMLVLGTMLFYDLHLGKNVDSWLYAFPAYLLGMDITKAFGPKK